MEARERTSRAEWQRRIERWSDSGLSAEQFAAELGINAGTLRHWKYFLGKQGGRAAATEAPLTRAADLVEVRTSTVTAAAASSMLFELELGAERKLRIPSQFDAAALDRLLVVLERR